MIQREKQSPPRLSPTGLRPWLWCWQSSVCCALMFPPIAWWPLAFVAPIGWVVLCLLPKPPAVYRWLFLLGLAHALFTFHFLRLPHWTTAIGGLFLAAYVACFDVLLVAISRRLIHTLRCPALIVIPLVWVSLEWVRANMFPGVPIALWGHALYLQTVWIQCADIAGELTVTYLIWLIVTGFTVGVYHRWVLLQTPRPAAAHGNPNTRISRAGVRQALPMVVAMAALIFMVAYGATQSAFYQTSASGSDGQSPPTQIALIQGAQDVQLDLSAEQANQQTIKSYQQHVEMTIAARKKFPDLRAAVWAESMFPLADVMAFDPSQYREPSSAAGEPPENAAGEEGSVDRYRPSSGLLLKLRQEIQFQVLESTGTGPAPNYPFQMGLPLIVGTQTIDPDGDAKYNSAVQFDAFAQVQQRYFKTHLVPFGEYVPLGDRFPVVYQWVPIPSDLRPGPGMNVMQIEDKRLLPTICFESMVSRLVRRYVLEANANTKQEGEPRHWVSAPDALLNLSNDGWFWGSSALDLHLSSNVFRAVENRIPHLVVSNTGISAQILPDGTIDQQLQKRQPGSLLAAITRRPPQWQPWFWTIGDWPWISSSIAVVLALLVSRLIPRAPQATPAAEPAVS